jgi:hypothetical protein
MHFYFVTFRSVTFAQRAEKLLNQSGYRPNLMRTPRWIEEQGCGYALKLWTNQINVAVNLLRENKIQLRKVYVQQEEGRMEEVKL